MLKNRLRWFALSQITFCLAACASNPEVLNPFSKDLDPRKFNDHCRAEFKRSDRQILRAGTHDATFPTIPGFQYLRNSRLMASYAEQAATDRGIFQAWSLEMRDNDSYSREAELKDLGMPLVERTHALRDLRYCAVWLSNVELDDQRTLERLIDRAEEMPDERTWRGLIARFVWTRSDILREAERRQTQIQADFAQPVSALTSPGPVVVWQAPAPSDPTQAAINFSKFPHDQMGRVGLTPDAWAALAVKYAPRWAIEQGGSYDKIGTPTWTTKGPSVDPATAVVYYLPAYTRSGDNDLIQFNYFIFFSAHTSPGSSHIDDGNLDGLIWRVTLDPDGKPILYDVIHASGFDQMWFPLPPLKARRQHGSDRELPFIPQAEVPSPDFLIRVQSGTHNLRRLLAPAEQAGAPVQTYELRRYEDLYELPAGGEDHTHNFFNPKGFVDGTQRQGSMFFSALGVRQAGKLREWGKHPTSLAATHYFDDPHLAESMFEMPSWPPPPPMP